MGPSGVAYLILVGEVALGALSSQHVPLQLIQKHLQLPQHLPLLPLTQRRKHTQPQANKGHCIFIISGKNFIMLVFFFCEELNTTTTILKLLEVKELKRSE